jgi:hypothetical protein
MVAFSYIFQQRRSIMEHEIKVKEISLADTLDLMNSGDYKDRFKAEYWQTKIRYERLKKFNTSIEAAERTAECFMPNVIKRVDMPKHDCPSYLLKEQQNLMGQYLHILEVRAVIEGVDLDVI